jgi:predicted alpha/beta-fold hydrolase
MSLSASFTPPPFVENAHFQTLLGALDPFAKPQRAEPMRIAVQGGSLDARMHRADPKGKDARAAVLVLHGITGAADDDGMGRFAQKFNARGIDALTITMRGGPGSHECEPALFHSASTDDVRAALSLLLDRYEAVGAAGISLGGHLLLRVLAEWAERAPSRFAGVAAVSPPIEIGATADHLRKPHGKPYELYMVRRLLERARVSRARLPPDVREDLVGKNPKVKTVRDYNERMAARVYGYADIHDYHARASVASILRFLTKPALVVHAKNDPIVPVDPLLRALAASDAPASLTAIVTEGGGHVGFIAKKRPIGDPDRRWAENRAVDFVHATLC